MVEQIIPILVEQLWWIFSNLAGAANIVVDNLLFLYAGIIFGMLLGVIPGMGGLVAITVLFPFTLGLDQFQAFTLLTGAVGATTFTGSITSILINTPGTSSNAATLIDGYPLTQRGKSAMAITASAVSSASGAVFATIIFILLIPVIIEFALLFGSSEIFLLILGTIILLPFLVSGNTFYSFIFAGIGVLFATVGIAPQSGEGRFIFGIPDLQGGIPLIPVLIGTFAIAEVLRLASIDREYVVDPSKIEIAGSKMDGLQESIKHKFLILRAGIIGLVVGAIPGAGGSAAAFIAYAHAAQSSDVALDEEGNRIEFGEGRIEGVIAPEGANDAKDAGMLIPTFGLGVPGNGTMAVFLAALMLHGIQPGPRFIPQNVELVFVISISLIISNISTSVIGLSFSTPLTKILSIPLPRITVIVVTVSLIASFVAENAFIYLVMSVLFGFLGIVMIYNNINRIPFVIAFILGGLMEENFHIAYLVSNQSYVQAFLQGWLNLLIIGAIVLSLAKVIRDRFGHKAV